MVCNLCKLFSNFKKHKKYCFIYPSQKYQQTYPVTKRVPVDTEKTLIISHFGSIGRLSDHTRVPKGVPLGPRVWSSNLSAMVAATESTLPMSVCGHRNVVPVPFNFSLLQACCLRWFETSCGTTNQSVSRHTRHSQATSNVSWRCAKECI